MKKIIYCFITVISFVLFSSCSSLLPPTNANSNINQSETTSDSSTEAVNSNIDDSKTSSTYTIKDYFPFNSNAQYIYEGTGNEFASYKLWTDFIKDDKVQIRTNNGGTETVKVIQNKDGELKLIFQKDECYYREDLTSKQSNKDEVLLKEPLQKDTSWTLSDGRKRYISNIDVDVTTPSGNYKAIEVTTESKDKNSSTIDYYGLNTGLVKTVFKSDSGEVTSLLSKIEKDSPLSQTIKFYYPNVDEDKVYYTKKALSFNTNDMTKMILEKAFRDIPNKNLGKVLSSNAKIMSLYLGSDNMVYVDFTKEFVSEMNAGAGYESLILQSITNTLGDYYGVDKVYLTVNNKPYSSGHILKNKGEAFVVDKKNAVELKK